MHNCCKYQVVSILNVNYNNIVKSVTRPTIVTADADAYFGVKMCI